MSGISRLTLGLLIVFTLTLFGLAGELLYVFCSRRKVRRMASVAVSIDAELGGTGATPSCIASAVSLFYSSLFWKNRSPRIEPAAVTSDQTKTPATVAEDGEFELAVWRAAAFGPSRVLYTIREEEIEGADSDGEEDVEGFFSTPSSSPPFYTPASSPNRSPAGDRSPVR
ncbi:hypothetical protein AXF42_Ash009537 [Apostasia shenzhenica]|uniref:Uncharacterized protein n=1 Tax=Apostasia shenzhenica TaxID=1088818 RepID=A0A2I0B952_9ASPA|nr:hypothetical protein AXF42_Ash009537 [Apostasia shenzhenica]